MDILRRKNTRSAWNGANVEYGANQAYMDLYNWIQDHDLSDDDNYQYVCANIDIDNFIDYIAFETFIANLDWPANNVRCWQADNSLWRWLFFDGDACLFRPLSEYDPFYYATYDGDDLYYPTNKYSTLVFRRLLRNKTFKTRFVSRYYQLLSTTFRYESTKPFYDETYALISEEIDKYNKKVIFHDFQPKMEMVRANLGKLSFEEIIFELRDLLDSDRFGALIGALETL